MTERFPFGPSTRPEIPLFPREQRVSPDRPAAVQGAKRRSEPLTARTDLELFETRGKGVLAHWRAPPFSQVRLPSFSAPPGWPRTGRIPMRT